MQRHEVPTHLNLEDKAFAGLTMRQLMVAIIGLALAYSALSEAPLPLAVRLATGAMVLLMTAAISLWQPAGRSLEDWAFILLRYVSIPRVVVWRVRTSREAATPDEARFEVVLPDWPELHALAGSVSSVSSAPVRWRWLRQPTSARLPHRLRCPLAGCGFPESAHLLYSGFTRK